MIEHYRVYLARCLINGDLYMTIREWKRNGCQTYQQLRGRK
jgi:hypothetical protein